MSKMNAKQWEKREYKEFPSSEWYVLPATVTYLVDELATDISKKYFDFINHNKDYFTPNQRLGAQEKITREWSKLNGNLELKILKLDEYDKKFPTKSFFQNYASLEADVLYVPECMKCEPLDALAAGQIAAIQKTSYIDKVFVWPAELLEAVLWVAKELNEGCNVVNAIGRVGAKLSEGSPVMNALKVITIDAALFSEYAKSQSRAASRQR